MLTFSIEEALKTKQNTIGHYLYLYQDKEVYLYVGKSIQPIARLKGHLGIDGRSLGSHLGSIIHDNKPESLQWTLTLFSLEECKPLVEKHKPLFFQHYQEVLEMSKPYGPIYDDSLVDIAEMALIDHYQPCLNIAEVSYTNNIPQRYLKHSEDSSSMYLDL